MSVASRMPSRIGTMTFRSITATDSSSFSAANRCAIPAESSKGPLLGGNRLNAGHDPHRGKSQAADMAMHMDTPSLKRQIRAHTGGPGVRRHYGT